jgi:methionyl-tRNA formyltransferase
MRIVFIGTGEIGLPTLRMLQNSTEHELVGVITQPDKPAGRDYRIEPSAIKESAERNKTPVLQPKRIRDAKAISEIRAFAPDLIVVAAYGQILPRAVLESGRVACLNLHASLLPRWRGAAPIQAAIAAGDRETGITVMYMDEGLDTGDILLKREVEIGSEETGGSLHDRLGQVAPNALADAIGLLSQSRAPRIPQDHGQATYARKLAREDGRINWNESAEVIERKIRAFNPWPGAFTTVSDEGGREYRLKIFSADLVDLAGQKGEFLPTGDGDLIVAAGQGALKFGRVQLEGKGPMSWSEFVRGHARLLNRKLK